MALSQDEMTRLTTLLDSRKGANTSGFTDSGMFANNLTETAKDVRDTVGGIGSQISTAYTKSQEVLKDDSFSAPQKLMGVLGQIASGASGAIGETVVGAGKMALSQQSESALKEIASSVANGIAETDVARSVIDWYGSLDKKDKLFIDSAGGLASLMTDVLAPGAARSSIKPVLSTAKEMTGKLVTGSKSALSTSSSALGGATDVIKGIGIQAKDFGGRVVTSAKDTASESRRLASIPEPEAKLIRTGVDDAAIKLIKESTLSETTLYKSLVEKAKVRSGDLLAEQPKVIIGQEFMKPVDHLLKVRSSVGSKLGAVRTNLSNAPMDVTQQWREFRAYLDGKGITVDKNGRFTGSGSMAKSDLAELQKMYDEIRPDKTGKVVRSQKWLDEWSQRTYKEYDLRQAREQTFSDDVTKTAEKARSIFKQALPKEYRVLSTQYSETMKPIQEVVKLLGYKGDIDKLTTKEIKAAEVALRVIGNASDRPQSVIDELLRVSEKYGYKSDVDLKKVIIFADALEDVYPNITPKRGLTGSTARGVNQSGIGVAGDIATGNVKGLLGQVLNSSATQKEVQSALDEFLKSLNK